MAIKYATQLPPQDIKKHYTPEALAIRLISLVPLRKNDVVLDPSAGSNLVFYKNFPTKKKIKCEIDDGTDYLTSPLKYDWAITNPPYHLLRKYIDKAASEATKGFGFLVNLNGMNTLTPLCLNNLRDKGFYLRRLHVCNVQAWHGRYFFYLFSKEPGMCEHSWDTSSWKHAV